MNTTSSFDIDYISQLARIELSEAEKERYANQLASLVKYFEILESIDTQHLEATAHPWPLYNRWQEDIPGPVLAVDEVLKNAPASRDKQLVVPKVVE